MFCVSVSHRHFGRSIWHLAQQIFNRTQGTTAREICIFMFFILFLDQSVFRFQGTLEGAKNCVYLDRSRLRNCRQVFTIFFFITLPLLLYELSVLSFLTTNAFYQWCGAETICFGISSSSTFKKFLLRLRHRVRSRLADLLLTNNTTSSPS